MKIFDHTIYTSTKIDRHDKTSALSVPSVVDTYQYGYRVNIYSGSESAWTLDKQTTFTHDGWNLIQEQTASGFDISLTNSAFTQFHTSNYTYDANGNGLEEALYEGYAFELIDTAGVVKAHYEYSPFGKVVHKSGLMKDKNPFQFSTKYLDNETQLYYYGLRYYNPQSGRWINRDPIRERGGINIYGFVSNKALHYFDVLGKFESTPESLRQQFLDREYHDAMESLDRSYSNDLITREEYHNKRQVINKQFGLNKFKVGCKSCPGEITVDPYKLAGTASQGGASIKIEFKPDGKMLSNADGGCCCEEIRYLQVADIDPGKWQGREDAYVDPYPNDDTPPYYWTDPEAGSDPGHEFTDTPMLERQRAKDAGKRINNNFEVAIVCVNSIKGNKILGVIKWGYSFGDAQKEVLLKNL